MLKNLNVFYAPESEIGSTDPTPAKRRAPPKIKVNGAQRPKAKAAPAPKAKAVKAKGKAAKAAKPRKADPTKRDDFGLRVGSIKSKAAAMYASAKGATLAEVKAKTGSVQFNVINELEEKGFKIKRTLEDGNGNRKVTRFHLKAK